jgi:predicted alpha/beta-fold hydrolase
VDWFLFVRTILIEKVGLLLIRIVHLMPGKELLHPWIKGAVLVSGAFGMEFADWWRYRELFQSLIVPELVKEFLIKYGAELETQLSTTELHALGQATTYQALVEHLLLPISGGDEDVSTYTSFQQSATSSNQERAHIAKPTLLLCALDDPLHCPDLIGVDLDAPRPDNLCYMVTEEGGHVSFPTSWDGSSSLLKETVVAWSSFCLKWDKKNKAEECRG